MSGKAAREILGFLAVVAGLVFVGLEIQQNNVQARGATRQAMADASRDLALAISTDTELVRVWYSMWRPDSYDGRAAPRLTYSDTLQAEMLMRANLRNVENVFLQTLEGVVGQTVLGTYAFSGAQAYRAPGFAPYWEDIRANLDSRFVEAFEEANGLR